MMRGFNVCTYVYLLPPLFIVVIGWSDCWPLQSCVSRNGLAWLRRGEERAAVVRHGRSGYVDVEESGRELRRVGVKVK